MVLCSRTILRQKRDICSREIKRACFFFYFFLHQSLFFLHLQVCRINTSLKVFEYQPKCKILETRAHSLYIYIYISPDKMSTISMFVTINLKEGSIQIWAIGHLKSMIATNKSRCKRIYTVHQTMSFPKKN